jgi:hypothetical protein
MIPLHPQSDKVGSIDWLNEATCSYIQGDMSRANVAAIMWHSESVEALRLLLLESSENYGSVEPLGGAPRGT